MSPGNKAIEMLLEEYEKQNDPFEILHREIEKELEEEQNNDD